MRAHHSNHIREAESGRAEEIVEAEIMRFAEWLGTLAVRPTIAALREHATEIVDQVLSENAGRWESASERDLARVEAIARAVTNRILHAGRAAASRPPTARPRAVRARRRRRRGRAGVRDSRGLAPATTLTPLRLCTRGSALAIVQAELTVAALAAQGIESTVVPVVTTGDRRRAAPDKEKWVKELELALLADEVDLAVHSAKDVPGALPEDLELVGALPRADAHDALCGATSLAALAELAVADRERLVDDQDVVGLDAGEGELQPRRHAGRIGPHGQIDELLEARERHDVLVVGSLETVAGRRLFERSRDAPLGWAFTPADKDAMAGQEKREETSAGSTENSQRLLGRRDRPPLRR